MDIKQTLKDIKKLAEIPMLDDVKSERVEIIMLKYKEEPEVIDKAINRIIHNTEWPFKLTIYDNRLNSANTSKIWNKLINQSTCDYVLILDSDSFVSPIGKENPCWLTRLMESIHQTGVVVPVSSTSGGARQHVSRQENYPSFELNKDIWSGFCFLFSKEAYDKIGLFNENFYIYGQDSEWAFRAAKKVGGAVMRKDVLVEHIGGYSFNKDPMRAADKLYARELFLYLTKKK